MSRTHKDKPHKLQHPRWDVDFIWCDGWGYRYAKTTKTKKRKEVDTEDHWMTTPGWWVSLTMTRPERRYANAATHKLLRLADIEDADIPDLGRKPHNYYW